MRYAEELYELLSWLECVFLLISVFPDEIFASLQSRFFSFLFEPDDLSTLLEPKDLSFGP